MGPKDVERLEESKAEGQEQRALKMQDRFATEFEKKKREKLGLKKGEPAESDMLEWIDLQKQLQVDRDTGKSYVTTPWEKTKGVFLDNPLVPIGLGATTFALTMGLVGFVRGSPNQRFWMWSRVGAQGGTIAALLVSAYYAGIRQQEKGKNAVSTHEPLSK